MSPLSIVSKHHAFGCFWFLLLFAYMAMTAAWAKAPKATAKRPEPKKRATKKQAKSLQGGFLNGQKRATLPTWRRKRRRKLVKIRSPRKSALSHKQITKVVGKNLYKLKRCYQQSRRKGHPTTAVPVSDVRWSISPKGKVSHVKVKFRARYLKSKARAAFLAACLTRAIKTFVFPKFKGERVDVRYPYISYPTK